MAAARNACSRRPVRVAARLALILLLAAGLAALTVIAAPARAGDGASGAPTTALLGAAPAPAPSFSPALIAPLGEELRGNDYGKDWQHCVQVVANLRAEQPKVPLVVLLGGSSARECTVLDDNWERQIERRSGYVVDAYNLGSKHRTYAQDLAFVKLLPGNVPTIVYIGVNLGRFCLPVELGEHHAARSPSAALLRAAPLLQGPHPELLREALLRLVLAVERATPSSAPTTAASSACCRRSSAPASGGTCGSCCSTCRATSRPSAPRSTVPSPATTPAARASRAPGTSRGCTSTPRRSS